MSTADIIIVIVIVLALGAIIAANVIKRKKGGSPCSHCPSRKDCASRVCVKNKQKSVLKEEVNAENRVVDDIKIDKLIDKSCSQCTGDCLSCKGKDKSDNQCDTDHSDNGK